MLRSVKTSAADGTGRAGVAQGICRVRERGCGLSSGRQEIAQLYDNDELKNAPFWPTARQSCLKHPRFPGFQTPRKAVTATMLYDFLQ